MPQLEGKRVLVTGGSRGIGLRICQRFIEEEAATLAIARDTDELERAREAAPGLLTLSADVSDVADIERVGRYIAEIWGRLDILVNNAGVLPPESDDLVGQDDSVFELTMRVNVAGPHLCTKRLLPLLLESDEPRVINVGSMSGVVSPYLHGVYGVSKAALHALTIAWANALQGRVMVNGMTPGWVRTEMAPEASGDPRDSAETALFVATLPWGKTGGYYGGKREIGWNPRKG